MHSGDQRRWTAIAGVVAAFGVLCLVVVRAGPNIRTAADETLFQLPTVRQFAAQWPRPDLADYPTSSSPGYHLVLAAVSRYASDDVRVLRAAGGLFGVAMVALLAWAASRRSAWLALPVAASSYVLTSTVFVLPENAAWLLVLIAWLLCLRAEGGRLLWASAVTLAALVFVRQSGAFMVGVFAVTAAWLYARQPGRLALALTAAAPAVLVLGILVWLWHGLCPPAFQPGNATWLRLETKSGGLTIGAPMTALVLLGLFGTPLLPWLWPAEGATRPAVVGAIVGAILGAVPRSFYVQKERAGGFWNAVQHVPVIAGRSPLVIGLATLGGMAVAVALTRLRGRDRWVMAAALAGFVAAQSTTPLLWQRYYEPFVLLWLALAATLADDRTPRRTPWRAGGLAVVVLLQLAATWVTIRGAADVPP